MPLFHYSNWRHFESMLVSISLSWSPRKYKKTRDKRRRVTSHLRHAKQSVQF